ncbi:helix-turn-helix domain-containing protein [Bradyrhizobium sp. BRP05]|nr:helix-turn-helix domain-containing protein [Bradyrhizobium sp. BRP05]
MSHEAQTWAIKIDVRSRDGDGRSQSGLARKAVLMYLANRANSEDGASWPSQVRVAADLCCSERCVRDALRDLEDMGIIRRVSRQGTSDMIYINFGYRPPAADAGPSDPGPRRGPRRGQAAAAAAGDSAASVAGDDRQEMPAGPAAGAGGDRQELPPNHQDESSENRQDEPRRTALWPADFREQFRKAYPKRHNNNWKQIFVVLERINYADEIEFTDIMAGLEVYAERMNRRVAEDPKNAEFIALATTWLNQERWMNERPGVKEGSTDAAKARIKSARVFV